MNLLSIEEELAHLNLSQLPTEDDLPCDDGVPMETERHKKQMDLLIYSLATWLGNRGYVNGNMFVYFSLKQIRTQDFKGPDVFVALNVPCRERKSWVVWQEKKTPDVVIELLSETTANYDKEEKKQIYQDKAQVPEYYWFDPFEPEDFAGFRLEKGIYQPLVLDERQRLVSESLGLALARWTGVYADVLATWLRWETLAGELLPTPQETQLVAEQWAQHVEQWAYRAEQQAKQAKREAKQQIKQAQQDAKQQVKQVKQQLKQVKQQADVETAARHAAEQRVQSAENEIARLKALLAEKTG